jgi:hypothetical protein
MAQRRTIKRAATPRKNTPPRANWQDVGRDLRRQYIVRGGRPYDHDWYRADLSTPRSRRAAFLFQMIAHAQNGDPSALLAFLRSGQKLSRFDRNQLADLFKVIFTPKAKPGKQRGRPKQTLIPVFVSAARRFYREWKDANRLKGISDWGHGDEMKDESCRFAIASYVDRFPSLLREDLPTFEQVRDLMERSQKRQGLFTFEQAIELMKLQQGRHQ